MARMIERIAQAMSYPGDWERFSPRAKLAYRMMARACLHELMSPTKYMVEAGTVTRYHFSVAENGQATSTEIFQAMIRAALDEEDTQE
jgi:hypothetical protein